MMVATEPHYYLAYGSGKGPFLYISLAFVVVLIVGMIIAFTRSNKK